MTILALYVLAGLAAGFFGGLLGIGGGLVLVPVLAAVFKAQQIADPVIMPLALGTSLAAIIFTSVSSVRAHHARGAVDWQLVRRMIPGLVVGALLGASLSSRLSSGALQVIFLIFAIVAATQMLTCGHPQAARRPPGPAASFVLGGAIATIASLVGVGGASMAIPFLTWCSVPVRSAIGSASAFGLPIALAGATGYIVSGFDLANLPPLSIGFVHLPALAAVTAGSLAAVPFGAALSHKLPVAALKRIFALTLYAIAGKMLAAIV